MDRVEATGVGVAVVGHGALLAALTLGLTLSPPPPPGERAMEVSFVDEVALTSSAAQTSNAPAPAASASEPAPPQLALLTPAPAPSPEPAPRPVPQRPPTPGPRDWNPEDFVPKPGPRTNPQPAGPPARVTGPQAADIASAIARQVQPCADRQIYPGPGAERIVTAIRLRLNRDGSLAGRPVVRGQRGLDDENRRYAERVADIAVAAFTGCSPLRGLPGELYDVPGGWSNFTMNYRLPG